MPASALSQPHHTSTSATTSNTPAGTALAALHLAHHLLTSTSALPPGEWLCPHCYEEEHPEEGWLCNSSICMKRAGRAPTGIAIFEAQRRGYPSVAHWLQVGPPLSC